MLLSDREIKKEIAAGRLVLCPALPSQEAIPVPLELGQGQLGHENILT